MSWQVAVVDNPARLSSRNRQLVISQNEESYSLPLEDLGALVLSNPQVSVTVPLLQGAAKEGVPVIVCDAKHTPCGIFLPFSQHSRTTAVINAQLNCSIPFKKRCWQQIVVQKVLNQAHCLSLVGREPSRLLTLSRVVETGDKSNIEAQAARHYWTKLFSAPFKRSADTGMNAALNYGYALIRSAVARAIVARGLLPAIGVHHANKLNAFNLADDLMEPFRPFVDFKVQQLFSDLSTQFDQSVRAALIALLPSQVSIGGEQCSILRATEVVTSTFVSATESGNAARLMLPTFSQ